MKKPSHRSRGFTLVELIVVMAIVGILAAIAIPSMSRLGLLSRDELTRTSREVHSMLRAARLYAATYRVNAAVVYNLDNFVGPGENPGNTPGLAAPPVDTLTGQLGRYLNAAVVMYQLPGSGNTYLEGAEDAYVIASEFRRGFESFPENMGVLLKDPTLDFKQIYSNNNPRFAPDANQAPDNTNGGGGVGVLGMYTGGTGAADDGVVAILDGGPYGNGPLVTVRFPAHVFSPAGRLLTDSYKERYTIFVGPKPDASLEDRLINPESLTQTDNLVGSEIEIFRTTGRVKIAS